MYTAGQVVREAQSCNSHFLDVQRTVYLTWPTLSICLILGLVEEKKKMKRKEIFVLWGQETWGQNWAGAQDGGTWLCSSLG